MAESGVHERVLELLKKQPAAPDVRRGYLDLLGTDEPEATGVAQWLMHTGFVPAVYERWWRPALFRVAKGPMGPSVADEQRLVREWLALAPGRVVLDVACGPGNFTRGLATAVGAEGLAIGLDGSATMLGRAVGDSWAGAVDGQPQYVRADAGELPFRAGCFDAVCCFAALAMFADPMRALDEMTAVLRPGGRIALMANTARGGPAERAVLRRASAVAGMTMFDPDEIPGALRERGYQQVREQTSGLIQFVGATRPG